MDPKILLQTRPPVGSEFQCTSVAAFANGLNPIVDLPYLGSEQELWRNTSHRYTQCDENTAHQVKALRLAAMAHLMRAAMLPLSLPLAPDAENGAMQAIALRMRHEILLLKGSEVKRFGWLSTSRSSELMRVIEVNMEQRRSEGEGETGDPRENPSTIGIIRHDSRFVFRKRVCKLAHVIRDRKRGRLIQDTHSPSQIIRDVEASNDGGQQTMPLVGGFPRGTPVRPAHSFPGTAPYSSQSPTPALKTSLLRAAKISSLIRRGIPAEFPRVQEGSGIRTHAHRSGLRPERSALDHSAILTTDK
ncbi:hypothetical protein PR048_023820, partial [Dryococelus australis]